MSAIIATIWPILSIDQLVQAAFHSTKRAQADIDRPLHCG